MQRFLDLFISINCSTCFRRFLHPSSGAQNCTYSVRYCQTNTAAIVDEMELRSISSTIAAGSSIGLIIPDAVCRVSCSWWWAEEPPETFRAIYRNKLIEKTLHLFGCTLKIWCWYDIFNCNWVATRWQLFSTHVHTNNTGNVTTQTIQRTQKYIEQHKKYTGQHNNQEECGPCPVFGGFTLAFALQLRKRHGKTSVRVAIRKHISI